MDFLKQILSDQTGPLIEKLTAATGFQREEAQAFVPAAITQVIEKLQGGGFDLGRLLGGGAGDLVSKLDPQGLAQTTNIDADKAREGLAAVVPGVLDAVKQQAGDAGNLLSALGGGDAPGVLNKLGGFLKR